jgi:hypothetical protein
VFQLPLVLCERLLPRLRCKVARRCILQCDTGGLGLWLLDVEQRLGERGLRVVPRPLGAVALPPLAVHFSCESPCLTRKKGGETAHTHPLHAVGTFFATDSSTVIGGIAVANNTEFVAGAVSDRIINDLTFLARQPINLPVFMLREKDTAVILYGGLDGLEVLVSEGREGQRRRTCS